MIKYTILSLVLINHAACKFSTVVVYINVNVRPVSNILMGCSV